MTKLYRMSMTYDNEQGFYDYKKVEHQSYDNVCNCCGARIGESDDPYEGYFRGIGIYPDVRENSLDEFFETTTIQTRAGPVTVKVQHTWIGEYPEPSGEDD